MNNIDQISANLLKWLFQRFDEKFQILNHPQLGGCSEFYLRLCGPDGDADVATILVGEGSAFESRRRMECLVQDQSRELIIAVHSEVNVVEVWQRVKKNGGYQWSYEPDDPDVEVLIDEWCDNIPASVLYRGVEFEEPVI